MGAFALRQKLNPKISTIWISSGGAYGASLNVQRLFNPPKLAGNKIDGTTAYASCKRAQIIMARKLGDQVMHPGWVDTPGVQTSLPRFAYWTKNILRTPAQGIDTIVWLIMKPPQERGFWFDRAIVPEYKFFWTGPCPSSEEDELMAKVKEYTSKAGIE